MKNNYLKEIAPYVAIIVIFILITLIYFHPLLSGKKLNQGDIKNFKGMSKEIVDYREKTGEQTLWTNSMFGGMPAYQISVKYKSNLFKYIDDFFWLGLPRPANYVFLYFIGFFILMLVLRINPWLSLAGAIAFAFSSYFFIILEAGHNTKAHAIGYMAPVIAGIILTYRGKYILGGILTALFLALEIQANHPQITYYLAMVVVILGLFELYHSINEKRLTHFLKATGVLFLALFLAATTHFAYLWNTYEHGKKTIRGKSELTFNKDNKTSGLDKDYATQWSYGIGETFSLMIPNIKGGATEALASNQDALEKVDNRFRKAIAGQNHYWGNQPFTSGPVYAGAIVVFLFVLGLFIVKGRLKWILFTAVLLSILLSWGKNFMPLTDLFLDYLPGYNKFRAVSMILVIAELCIPVLAILALNEILKKPAVLKENRNKFYIAFGLTGGLSLIFYLFPDAFFNFLSRQEIVQFNEYRKSAGPAQVNDFIENLEAARIAIFKSDAIRSFFYIAISAVLLWVYSMKKIKKEFVIPIFILLILTDMAFIVHRYINSDDYVRKTRMEVPYQPGRADKEILKDPALSYRVLNISLSTFNDASTSYFHKSIGGYHGAKLRRYQELIDYGIQPEMAAFIQRINDNPDPDNVDKALRSSSVLNMLNTKYIIIDPSQRPLLNNYAMGNAWFVKDYVIVENADEEILGIESFDPENTAIINKEFTEYLKGYANGVDSNAQIKLVSYKPNELIYEFTSDKDQLVVFSEVFYRDGWKAFVDEKPTPHFRANYVLRAMVVPKGQHTIRFAFESEMYRTGEAVSLVASIILILLILGGVFFEIRKRRLLNK